MEYIDYYKVLGVKRDSSQDEITKAYKRLARKYHPDLNKEANAEAKFKEVNEAYEVLKNPETRKRFDTLGANWKHGSQFEPPPGWGGGSFGGGSGFSDFFDSVFGNAGGAAHAGRRGGVTLEDLFSGGFGGGGSRGPVRGRDIESTLTVDLEDAYHGNKRTVAFEGSGGRRQYEVKVPKGIRSGERIRLAGQGEKSAGGNGDLYLTIHLRNHPTFQRESEDLVVRVPVPAWDAALGAKIPVPTLDGTVNMTLPAGMSSGKRLRLRGKGMPRRGGGHGDLYAEILITVPKDLSEAQRRLFEELRESELVS